MGWGSETLVALLSCRWHPPSIHQEKWAHPFTEVQRCMHCSTFGSTERPWPAMFSGVHLVPFSMQAGIATVVVVVVVVVVVSPRSLHRYASFACLISPSDKPFRCPVKELYSEGIVLK